MPYDAQLELAKKVTLTLFAIAAAAAAARRPL
eukprot:SAG22_NODE_18516_length_286_cov_0.786096_1_plen_31_part_01